MAVVRVVTGLAGAEFPAVFHCASVAWLGAMRVHQALDVRISRVLVNGDPVLDANGVPQNVNYGKQAQFQVLVPGPVALLGGAVLETVPDPPWWGVTEAAARAAIGL